LPFEGNYLNEGSRQLHSIVHSSLKSVFTEIKIIAMGRNFFISGEKVSIDLLRHSTLLEQKNLYYNKNFISEELVLLRSREIESQLEDEARINSNLAPYGYYAYLGNWVSMFNIELRLLLYPLLFVLVLILVALKPVQLGVFTGGFTVSALQFLVMIAFQSLYGYIYLLVALFIAVFMGGLGLGSFYFHRIVKASEIKHLARNQALIGLSALTLPLIALLLSGSNELPAVVIYFLFSLFVALTGLLMGVHFGIGSELSTGKVGVIASGNYAADLAGSALGAFIVSLFIFPLTGIYNSCLVLAGLNFVVLPVVFKRGKNL
jgi:spermidine synthase